MKALERGNLFNIFGGVEEARLNRSRAPLAAAIFAIAIAAATFKLASLPVAMLGGAFLMLLTRCLSPEEAYRQVEWKVLILIGALLSLGAAMEASGAGKYLAQQLIGVVGADSRYALLTCFLRPDRGADAAHVEPGGSARRAAHRHADGHPASASIRAPSA